MKLKFIITIILFSFCAYHIAFSQEKLRRTLSIQEWIDEMVNCEDSVYYLIDADIVYNHKKDKVQYRERDVDNADEIVIKSAIVLSDCNFNFDHGIVLNNFSFKDRVVFELCKAPYFDFINCTFEKFFCILECEFKTLTFSNTTIKGEFWEAGNIIKNLRFDHLIYEANSYNKFFYFSISSTEIGYINIFNSKFILSDSLKNIPIESSKIPEVYIRVSTEALHLKNDTFDLPVNFGGLTVNEQLRVRDCKFNNYIGTGGINFPERNTNFDWDMLTNKLCIFKHSEDSLFVFRGKTDNEIKNSYDLKELIASYNKFFKLYRERGDIESANACYVEMKDIETRRWQYLYKQDPTLQNFSKWKLNQFLKIFCDYGTSPTKSLIISFYVILAFALFYFFFYSEWDQINRSYLVNRYRKMMTWFRSEQSMEDFYSERYKEEIQSYEDFKMEIEEGKIELPLYFRLIGRPLYHLSLLHHKITSWFYRRTDILSGRWTELRRGRRIYVSTVSGIGVVFYIIYLILIRSINSLFLSINTFSTLGFGDIPVKGISRYMAILEGFLGWFLLSIFSVSLISQILQN
ncbi:MAG: two pore domain potassium channel family protein [Cytophagales bacterium]|nr:two pore domain potassium channel family protein [Cytophagales bacterium]